MPGPKRVKNNVVTLPVANKVKIEKQISNIDDAKAFHERTGYHAILSFGRYDECGISNYIENLFYYANTSFNLGLTESILSQSKINVMVKFIKLVASSNKEEVLTQDIPVEEVWQIFNKPSSFFNNKLYNSFERSAVVINRLTKQKTVPSSMFNESLQTVHALRMVCVVQNNTNCVVFPEFEAFTKKNEKFNSLDLVIDTKGMFPYMFTDVDDDDIHHMVSQIIDDIFVSCSKKDRSKFALTVLQNCKFTDTFPEFKTIGSKRYIKSASDSAYARHNIGLRRILVSDSDLLYSDIIETQIGIGLNNFAEIWSGKIMKSVQTELFKEKIKLEELRERLIEQSKITGEKQFFYDTFTANATQAIATRFERVAGIPGVEKLDYTNSGIDIRTKDLYYTANDGKDYFAGQFYIKINVEHSFITFVNNKAYIDRGDTKPEAHAHSSGRGICMGNYLNMIASAFESFDYESLISIIMAMLQNVTESDSRGGLRFREMKTKIPAKTSQSEVVTIYGTEVASADF